MFSSIPKCFILFQKNPMFYSVQIDDRKILSTQNVITSKTHLRNEGKSYRHSQEERILRKYVTTRIDLQEILK